MVKPTKTKPRQQQQLLQLSLSSFLLRILPSFSSSEHGHVAAASSSSSSSSAATGGGSRYCKYPPSPAPPARSSRNNRLNRSHSRSCEILTTPKSPKSNRTPQPPRRKMNLLAVASPSAKSQSTADLRTITERPESSSLSPNERAIWWTELSTMLSKAGTMWHKVNRNWFRRRSTCPKQERRRS